MVRDAKVRAEICARTAAFLLLALAGTILGAATVRDFARARASLEWPAVDGVVLSSPENGELRYAYVAAGKTHQSSRARFATAILSSSAAPKPAGAPIKVRVDPKRPSLSVLEPGGSAAVFAAAATGAGLLVFVGLGGMIRTLLRAGAVG
jgi:hypothetical protein